MSWTFTIPIMIVLSAMAYKKWNKKRTLESEQRQPGRSPENPIHIQRFDEMDAFVQNTRCPCGGYRVILSEGSRQSQQGHCRVLHTECSECEAPADYFFNLKRMQH